MQNTQMYIRIPEFQIRQKIKKILNQKGTLVVEQICSTGGVITGAGGAIKGAGGELPHHITC